ncbi:MAG: phosphotransferase [Flavobacteriia bacterium]|nr:phosphotransferase [Flavobacteriia bacterium]OIP47552.1 MAG: aminoglycoside phosphotransferase [Flavobacteriaceae bacterium CG2_30_31_66]PIV97991.1 MAG: aminoglycoside phosphotransferase [Flavobacteriaceae bacterium CG17_big_fil_post_rev_8_21_14_2_50_31_13]PIX12327.1 MAG: aminoglycoside phosphotransferase [Flavobacteriaceae bacterium CG_4_8_14_3_um_filter_31_8]PIY15816.1 MAG: aminoglycoside phosphotransferase [Flavobacteriaceae bacterium CG_4_10_14_3_um_filter_31_253]PIZ09807.1 MAG: aminogl
MFILNANEPKELAIYLQKKQWLGLDEKVVSLSKPGEGNMNYVLRVDTGKRTFIVKQSRAYVEKYPQVAAPEKRVITESAFYEKISTDKKVQKFMPKLIGIDAENNLMVIEDLGKANDFTALYDLQHQLKGDELRELIAYLNGLHASFQKTIIDDELSNLELRKLNHEHIFHYPFIDDNGFDLNSVEEGLQELALLYKQDAELKKQIELLGSLYLSNGKYLLHGDYYPGSWLKTADGIKVIDPEFCYYGSREFDLGVLLAHLYLTQQDATLHSIVINEYETFPELNLDILNGFTGVEIMRRLIGLAQLPLQMDLKTKKQLLEFAKTLILK